MGSKGWSVVCISEPLAGVRQALQGDLTGSCCVATISQFCCCVVLSPVWLPTEGVLASHPGCSQHPSSCQPEQCSWCLRVLGGLSDGYTGICLLLILTLILPYPSPPADMFNGHWLARQTYAQTICSAKSVNKEVIAIHHRCNTAASFIYIERKDFSEVDRKW